MRLLATGFLLFIAVLTVKAQPQLEIYPSQLEYPDIFHRLRNAFFINTGNQDLTIDSIYYSNNDFYYVRFNTNWRYPITIPPGDSIKMDCILAGYVNFVYGDTRDTIFVYNNSPNPYGMLQIKIDYYDNQYYTGVLQGNITSEGFQVSNADIYFLYGGNFVISHTTSDTNGNYSVQLPVGNYSIAAAKDSFYTSFYNQQTDPLSAEQVFVDTGSISDVNLSLIRKTFTQNSISGQIFDSVANYFLNKGIIIVRSGTHTPGKIKPGKINSVTATNTYTAFVNPDGTYNVDGIVDPGYYYVQAFSDYFVPAYYDSLGDFPSFWQNADSIYIGSPLTDADIYLPRDSSVGGGIITGTIQITGNRDSVISDAIVYAKSVDNDLTTYAFSQNNGSFRENFLPYGSYYLVAQKIGFDDAVSDKIIIDSMMTNIGNITLSFTSPNAVNDPVVVPNQIKLYQNYPNPFNPTTTIEFFIPSRTNVTLRVINILGQTVSTLQDGFLSAGDYKIRFNGTELSTGVYFISLITDNASVTRKILLLK
jgi:Secretion system C-terminal sorting domain